MKVLNEENIKDYKVEDFAYLLGENIYSYQDLKVKLQTFGLGNEEIKILEVRLEYANARVKKSLLIYEMLLFFFVPFGGVFGFRHITKTNFINIEEEREMGFYNRVKEFYLYSILGFTFHLTIVLMFIFIK